MNDLLDTTTFFVISQKSVGRGRVEYMSFSFEIVKKSEEVDEEGNIRAPLARVGIIHTPHGDMETPAFITVGTKATVKSLTPEQVRDNVGAQAVLANTYHLYLQPGDEIVARHGGFGAMMNIKKDGKVMPTFTDSGGFQVFSLGQAIGHSVGKIATSKEISEIEAKSKSQLKREEKENNLQTIRRGGVSR